MMETNDLISISEAARQLGLSRGSIYDAIARGDLSSASIGGRQFVSQTQVSAYTPRAYEGKRENKRPPGEKGPSRWTKAQHKASVPMPQEAVAGNYDLAALRVDVASASNSETGWEREN